MIKRILAAVMCLGVFLTVSCAEAPELLSFLPEATDANNFDGREIRLSWSSYTSAADYAIDTPQYDAYIKRLSDAEKNFNCNIITGEELGEINLSLDVMAGAYCVDIVLGSHMDLAEDKLMYPLNGFDGLLDPYEEKFGGLRYLEMGMVNGIPYIVTPTMWPGFEPKGFVLAYNRTMFNEYGLTDLHEYYENEIWTYDTFENEFIAKTYIQDRNGDLIIDFGTDGTDYYQCLMFSNDVHFVKVASDGSLIADPNSQAFRNALEWGQNLFKNYGDRLEGDMETHDQPEYRNQKMLVTTAYGAQITTGNIAYNDIATFETGVMPFPCGPDAEYGIWRQYTDPYGFSIPITADSPESAAMIIDYVSEPFEEFGGDAGLFDYYASNIFSTELDAKIFIEASQEPYVNYIGRGDREMNAIREGIGDITVNPNLSLNEAITKYQSILTEAIEKYMIPNYKAVYGE